MPYVICTLPNASDEINGIKFEEVGGVMVSVEAVDDDAATVFAGIEGYELADKKPSASEVAKAGSGEPAEAQPDQPAEEKPAASRKRKPTAKQNG